MKHEINMQPGFTTVSIYDGEFDYIECVNLPKCNEVINYPCVNGYKSFFIRGYSTVGVWQPKGTKLKRDAEKL